MEGRGVTNFSVSKPSHGFTTSTTEFDDELIKRGIVTTEQAMMAKGASAEEAFLLAQEKKRGMDSIVSGARSTGNAGNETGEAANGGDEEEVSDDDSFEDDFDDDDDDAFMQRYRQQRLDQLKQEEKTKKEELLSRSSQPSSVLHIRREHWMEAVNRQSNTRWVVVTMTEASGGRRDRVVQELYRFSREFNPMDGKGGSDSSDSDDDDSLDGYNTAQHKTPSQPPRLLTIDSSEAIPNWPEERVPAMFAYRNGVKQHEWIAGKRGEFPSREILEQLFRQWNVI